jgi:dTMP kinase
MGRGVFITFEGTEGSGKSTQIARLQVRLAALGVPVRTVREPGGTPLGEEIRHTLKESEANRGMTPETELLLINASRAQLVREVIRPALAVAEWVLCDRFHDSTTAYQGYGRQLDLVQVQSVIDLAVGDTQPDLTVLLMVPVKVSELRRRSRQSEAGVQRDHFEEAGRAFFERVERGYQEIALADPGRVAWIDAARDVDTVAEAVWARVAPWVDRWQADRSRDPDARVASTVRPGEPPFA